MERVTWQRRRCGRSEMAERGVWKERDGKEGGVEGIRWQRGECGRNDMAERGVWKK